MLFHSQNRSRHQYCEAQPQILIERLIYDLYEANAQQAKVDHFLFK